LFAIDVRELIPRHLGEQVAQRIVESRHLELQAEIAHDLVRKVHQFFAFVARE